MSQMILQLDWPIISPILILIKQKTKQTKDNDITKDKQTTCRVPAQLIMLFSFGVDKTFKIIVMVNFEIILMHTWINTHMHILFFILAENNDNH